MAYFDFLCDPLRSPLFPLRFNAANIRKTAEDAEDFAESAEKNSNQATSFGGDSPSENPGDAFVAITIS